MNHTIAKMHSRYHWHGAREGAAAASSRLDRLARWELPSCWEHNLGQVLGGDDRVIVLKALTTRFVLRLDEAASDTEIANRWASALAMAVIRAADAAPDLPDDEARVFENTPAFIAAFLEALSRGRTPEAAWAEWVFQPFAKWRDLGTAQAIGAILSEQPEEATAVLARLSTSGSLDAVLDALDEDRTRNIWDELRVEISPSKTADACRPLFAAALRIAIALGWKRPQAFTHAEAETAFREFLATDPEPPDWRDRRALATAVLETLAFLDRSQATSPVAASRETAKIPTAAPSLDQVLSSLEWLDTDWLRARINDASQRTIFSREDNRPNVSNLLATSPTPTPARRKRLDAIFEDLERLFDEAPPSLNRNHPDDPGNPIRMHAALVAIAPRWASDPIAHRVIDQICQAWREGRSEFLFGEDPIAVISPEDPLIPRVRKLLERLRGTQVSTPRSSEKIVSPPQPNSNHMITSQLVEHAPEPPRPDEIASPAILSDTTDNTILETSCAGIFLLTRVMLDLRLHEQGAMFLGQNFDDKGLGHGVWLLAVLGRFAAGSTEPGGTIDPGLALFAGLDPSSPLSNPALADAWRDWTGIDSAAVSWLRRLSGTRILSAANARLIWLDPAPLGGHKSLILSDGDGRIWSLGRSVADLDEAVELARQWAGAWTQAFGEPPSWVVDPRLCDPLVRAGLPTLPDDDPAPAAAAVLSALGAIAPSAFGGPGDLSLGLITLVAVRAAARWLKRLNGSTPAFLLENIFRRSGRISVGRRTIEVILAPKPLDIVLQLSGELDQIDEVPWLGRSLRFRIAEPS